MKKVLAFGVVALMATTMAQADFTISGLTADSAGLVGDAANTIIPYNFAGPDFATPWKMTVEGDLTEVLTGTYANEARFRVTAPDASAWNSAAWIATSGYTGTIHVGPSTQDTTLTGSAVGNWSFEAWESYDDGAGVDQQWSNLSITVFTPPPPPPVIYGYNMDTDPGFALDAAANPDYPGWAYGTPSGLLNDPGSGFTGNNVLGYNISAGPASNQGEYPNNMAVPEYATTPALDFSGYTDVMLEFARWLTVENNTWDHARIEVSNDGVNWSEIWANGSTTMSTLAWTVESYDISAYADNQSSVYVRWAMGTTDSSVNYGGWNIDDVVFRGIPEPASLVLLALGGLALIRRR